MPSLQLPSSFISAHASPIPHQEPPRKQQAAPKPAPAPKPPSATGAAKAKQAARAPQLVPRRRCPPRVRLLGGGAATLRPNSRDSRFFPPVSRENSTQALHRLVGGAARASRGRGAVRRLCRPSFRLVCPPSCLFRTRLPSRASLPPPLPLLPPPPPPLLCRPSLPRRLLFVGASPTLTVARLLTHPPLPRPTAALLPLPGARRVHLILSSRS